MNEIKFTDTHCHIHDKEFFPDNGPELYDRAVKSGVGRMVCVGTDIASSRAAVEFASKYDGCYATLGIHPHDAKVGLGAVDELSTLLDGSSRIVGIGEIGLDYYYDNSPRPAQQEMLHAQIELARRYDLPLNFHVRAAFEDFWPIFDQYSGIKGVLHSYTDDLKNLDKALARSLYIGVNGIVTFAADRHEVTKAIPLDRILLETDAPFLTPRPYRGKINEPAFVMEIARFVADLRSISLEELSHETEKNAQKLFF